MREHAREGIVTLRGDLPIWERVFTVNPLVLIGTQERDGGYDLAPKHMAIQMGWKNYFGFVCTPRHATYHNARRTEVFTVSYPRPNQVVLASLAAMPREGGFIKSSLDELQTFPASVINGIFIEDAYLFLECMLDRIIDDFADNSLIVGRILAAHVHEDFLRVSERDDQDLIYQSPLLAYLNPGRYTSIAESYSFPFPTDFMR